MHHFFCLGLNFSTLALFLCANSPLVVNFSFLPIVSVNNSSGPGGPLLFFRRPTMDSIGTSTFRNGATGRETLALFRRLLFGRRGDHTAPGMASCTNTIRSNGLLGLHVLDRYVR
ncbi:hypothetical protein B0T10DRAFT_42243 [Thelonectria olida]|uniref:Secreted protein n=1 Tax=Thelonectria olida TaxID=1576542 RepID=A0A9P8W3W6_9HYPO|nr:hypothetical protein B0T10DRAFT_42243 [Thelonectria olida]